MRPRPLASGAAALLLALIASGCTTTPTSRSEAAEARDMLSGYMDNRRAAVDRLNAAARSTYAALVGRHHAVTADRLRLDRIRDARAAADAILLDWKNKTTTSALVAMLEHYRERQVLGIEQRAAALQAAQQRYADSYAELTLDLDRLKRAVEKLDLLSRTEKLRARLPEFIGEVVEAYEKTRERQHDGESAPR